MEFLKKNWLVIALVIALVATWYMYNKKKVDEKAAGSADAPQSPGSAAPSPQMVVDSAMADYIPGGAMTAES